MEEHSLLPTEVFFSATNTSYIPPFAFVTIVSYAICDTLCDLITSLVTIARLFWNFGQSLPCSLTI
jgi:hypothetical protein